jgi:GWxTD domain-containing protein
MNNRNRHRPLLPVCLGVLMALAGCALSPRPALDPESRAFYETARLVMTKEESKIFSHLPDTESRQEFIRDFWDKRDPDPDTEVNEFKREFDRRVDYATERFHEGIPGWKTDRGRIYIYFGEPDKIDRHPVLDQPDVKGIQVWYYYTFQFAIRFMDTDGTGTYTFDPYYGIAGDFFQAVERVKLGMLPGLDQRFQNQYIDFDAEYVPSEQRVRITIPANAVIFTAKGGALHANFGVEFFIYTRKGQKIQRFRKELHFEKPESEVVSLKEIEFDVPLDLGAGKYILDITLDGSGLTRIRKMLEITHK